MNFSAPEGVSEGGRGMIFSFPCSLSYEEGVRVREKVERGHEGRRMEKWGKELGSDQKKIKADLLINRNKEEEEREKNT